MTLHTVTCDHSLCDHAIEDDGGDELFWCRPSFTFTCIAAPESHPHAECRWFCDDCEYHQGTCKNECVGYDHADPGVIHCTEGHPYVWHSECNPILWVENSDECEPEMEFGEPYHDGPIAFSWEGDYYNWYYAEAESVA